MRKRGHLTFVILFCSLLVSFTPSEMNPEYTCWHHYTFKDLPNYIEWNEKEHFTKWDTFIFVVAFPIANLGIYIQRIGVKLFYWYKKTPEQNLLEQSRLNSGDELIRLTKRLALHLRKKVKLEDVAQILARADRNRIFCHRKLFNYFQIQEYVQNSLMIR